MKTFITFVLDASVEQALELVKKCIKQTNQRFIASLPAFSVLVIDENGTRHLDDLVI
jgi:20S proteasome subunit beta 4